MYYNVLCGIASKQSPAKLIGMVGQRVGIEGQLGSEFGTTGEEIG